ncbi:hypothetical protein DSO57_1011176 [Entomophthora muscae]|uniref:Uncharacterized protein n=1 Tax=Entomophthora muscae TaxID=34485 RepID=A0ACC2TH79_9FUNG|nr:hypothetical protein DSO57_1011176 [Entomophthora muscae]
MLWWNWQNINSRSEPYNGDRNGRSVRTSDVMRPFGVTVASVLRTNTQEHCYIYPPFRTDRTRGSSRASEMNPTTNNELSLSELLGLHGTHSPKPKPLPKSFIAMSSMNEGKVRKIEQELLELDS